MAEASRQLAAIMFTDIVGYTALMGKDSEKALSLVRLSKSLQKPLVEKHNGKWLKEMGDGALAQFSSALDAVNCALEIQRSSRADFEGDLRIGIHSGDITIENDDIYGDGVNIASRLQSIADPGGVYISESIEKAIRGLTSGQARYLGEIKLKNVDYDVRTYALQGVGLPIPEVQGQTDLSGQFWAELNRRVILRAALVYIILSWILLQTGSIVFPALEFSSVTMTMLSVILVAGFPLSVYLAWLYEKGPQGFVRTTSLASWQNPYSPAKRKPLTGNAVIAVFVLIIVGMYAYPRFQGPSKVDKIESIVVLPFQNLTGDPDQEYFVDGMHDALIGELARIRALQVISRTSALHYRNSGKTIPQIVKELGVDGVIEGSVARDGDQVRIIVQLIHGSSDRHLWSDSYQRKLLDVLALQNDVAQAITAQIQTTLTTEETERLTDAGVVDPEAYEEYLLGRYQFNKLTGEGWKAAIGHFEQSINLDPSFVPAHAMLSLSYSWLGFYTSISPSELRNKALAAATWAVELDSSFAEAHASLAMVKGSYDWDWEGADRASQTAIGLNPNSWMALVVRGFSLPRLADLMKQMRS